MSQSLSNDQFLLKNTILPHELQRQKGALDKSSFFEFFAATQWLRKCDFSEDEILTGVVGDGKIGKPGHLIERCRHSAGELIA